MLTVKELKSAPHPGLGSRQTDAGLAHRIFSVKGAPCSSPMDNPGEKKKIFFFFSGNNVCEKCLVRKMRLLALQTRSEQATMKGWSKCVVPRK